MKLVVTHYLSRVAHFRNCDYGQEVFGISSVFNSAEKITKVNTFLIKIKAIALVIFFRIFAPHTENQDLFTIDL